MKKMENFPAILKHRGKNFSLTDWRKELSNLTQLENLIIDARIDNVSFSSLEGNNLRVACDKIIIKCSAFYGCEMPYTDKFASVLSQEIHHFILTYGYENLSLEEIIIAMEINMNHTLKIPVGIEIQPFEFFGRCVNVSFLSKVLNNYMAIRNLLDRKIQNKIDGY